MYIRKFIAKRELHDCTVHTTRVRDTTEHLNRTPLCLHALRSKPAFHSVVQAHDAVVPPGGQIAPQSQVEEARHAHRLRFKEESGILSTREKVQT